MSYRVMRSYWKGDIFMQSPAPGLHGIEDRVRAEQVAREHVWAAQDSIEERARSWENVSHYRAWAEEETQA
jgi:hypothetical protein